MTIETKVLLFYLSLGENEKAKFEKLLGPAILNKIFASADTQNLKSRILDMQPSADSNINRTEARDIAIMQLVRHIVTIASSNVQLAQTIESMVGKDIPRPEKRSKYELHGILLGELMEAPRSKLLQFRNELMHDISTAKDRSADKSNLQKWFSLILGTDK
jgi:hypothetical protein